MIGDFNYFFNRIYGRLPTGWFPDDPTQAPVISSIVAMIAYSASYIFARISYAENQARISTASGLFLDVIANEMLGPYNFPRRSNETDGNYRTRILTEILRTRGTRAAMVSALHDLTGYNPSIFQPVKDAQGWDNDFFDSPTMLYGSYDQPYTAYIDVKLPPGTGITFDKSFDTGFWDDGLLAYGDNSQLQSVVGEQEVFNTIAATAPAGTTILVSIHP